MALFLQYVSVFFITSVRAFTLWFSKKKECYVTTPMCARTTDKRHLSRNIVIVLFPYFSVFLVALFLKHGCPLSPFPSLLSHVPPRSVLCGVFAHHARKNAGGQVWKRGEYLGLPAAGVKTSIKNIKTAPTPPLHDDEVNDMTGAFYM